MTGSGLYISSIIRRPFTFPGSGHLRQPVAILLSSNLGSVHLYPLLLGGPRWHGGPSWYGGQAVMVPQPGMVANLAWWPKSVGMVAQVVMVTKMA